MAVERAGDELLPGPARSEDQHVPRAAPNEGHPAAKLPDRRALPEDPVLVGVPEGVGGRARKAPRALHRDQHELVAQLRDLSRRQPDPGLDPPVLHQLALPEVLEDDLVPFHRDRERLTRDP